MTITTQVPAALVIPAGRCRYPGCVNPARIKDTDTPGRRPGYCEQEVPEDRADSVTVLIRHTAMTAFRRRGQLAGQPAGDRPVTAALGKAAAIRNDALAAMSRLAAQLTAALDQLAVLGEQLAAASDPEAAEAQAEAVRAEAAARIEQARAEAASQASARHTAELDAAEARAAATEALTAMEHTARAHEQAEAAARDAAQALHQAREQAAARAEQADAAREHDQQRHATELAAATARLDTAQTTITSLREQLAHAHSALDRERAEQHKTVNLLHDLLTNRRGTPTASDPADGQAHPVQDPTDTGGPRTPRRNPTPHR
jgi:hypothetical protein